MSTKYGGRISDFDRWCHQHDVRLTDHAITRFDERMPVGAPDPCDAFEQGRDIPHPQLFDSANESPDRVRVWVSHEHGCAAFMITENPGGETVARTVYGPDEMAPCERAYVHSFGPHDQGDR